MLTSSILLGGCKGDDVDGYVSHYSQRTMYGSSWPFYVSRVRCECRGFIMLKSTFSIGPIHFQVRTLQAPDFDL
jgi:hypothetical protein